MTGGRLVQVFRSSRREGHYLFVDLAEGLARVPEPLLLHFGSPEPTLRLNLSRERRLASADAGAVLDAIAERGFYLQLPPQTVRDWARVEWSRPAGRGVVSGGDDGA